MNDVGLVLKGRFVNKKQKKNESTKLFFINMLKNTQNI